MGREVRREGDTLGYGRKEIQGIRLEGDTKRSGYDRKGIRREVRLEGDAVGRGYDEKGIHGDMTGSR